MSNKSEVRKFYEPVPVVCMPRMDGGYGIFAPNASISEPPHTLGIGDSEGEAWEHAHQRIKEIEERERLPMSRFPATEEAKQFEVCTQIKPGEKSAAVYGCIKEKGHGRIHRNGKNQAWITPAPSEDGIGSKLSKSINPYPADYAPDSELIAKIEVLQDQIVELEKDSPKPTRKELIAAAKADVMKHLSPVLADGPAEGIATERERCEGCMHFLPNHHPICFRKSEPVEPAAPVVSDEQFVREHCESVRRGVSGNVFGIPPGNDRRKEMLGTSWGHAAAVVRSILKASKPAPVVVPMHQNIVGEDGTQYVITTTAGSAPVVVRPEETAPKSSSLRQIVFNWMMGEADLTKVDGHWGGSNEVAEVDRLLAALNISLTAQPTPLPSDDEWIKCPQCNRENSADTWAKFGNKCPNCGDLFAKYTAALPVGQKETFEEWWKVASNGLYPKGSSWEYAARLAWNAAKGQKETK